MNVVSELEIHGRCWFRQAIPEDELSALERVSALGDRPGARLPWNKYVSDALGPASAMARITNCILPDARPVRLVSFNKSPASNWAVPWHQDRILALHKRYDVPGFSNWSQKCGTWHVEPPVAILEKMVFARVHFDDTDAANGCLQLAIGSHKQGLIPSDQATQVAAQHATETCTAKRGDILIAKALTLHKSSTSNSPSDRRALRIDYANFNLPHPLSWAYHAEKAV